MLSQHLESSDPEAMVQNHPHAVEATASGRSPARPSGLLPPFGVHEVSHLPTPQSPSNLAQYAPELNGSLASPVTTLSRDGPTPHAPAPRTLTSLREDVQDPNTSFMTPESSPLIHRKAMPPATPLAGSPSTGTANVSERAAATDGVAPSTVVETSVPVLAPAPIITMPVSSHSRGVTPASRLSSPFRARSSDRRAIRSKSPVSTDDIPMAVDMRSGPPGSPPPLATPVPQRALGGEIQRIHLQLAADRAEQFTEKEARRPDYLVREKRPRADEVDIPTLDELDAANASLGVTESPIKGRRLQLFQATSEETFEQSLLAGGYPGYGQSPGYKIPEPQTPLMTGKGSRTALSQRALQWLQQATPGQPGPSTVIAVEDTPSEVAESLPNEREIKKRKRLELFKDTPERRETGSKLYPVEIEGRGRLLLNVAPPGTAAHSETPARKRAVKRKRRRGARKGNANKAEDDGEPLEPNWPDAAFPWCMRTQERTEVSKMEQEERLKWIERFLERESESDDEEEQQVLRPPLRSHDNDQAAHRRGRGKMVPLRANPEVHAHNGHVLLPSDPADARAALLSKRSVRVLSFRGQGSEIEGEEVICIGCHRGDDGSELVQCDECQTWYHLRCIGIKTIAELGREEDPWFCDACLDIQPTFVPTDDRPLEPCSHRDTLFLQNPLMESPTPHWDMVPHAPSTPVRDSGSSSGDHTFSTRSSWGDSSRAGPSTPDSYVKTVRVYHTPGPFTLEQETLDPETPFDPTSTPSRGIKFSGGPPPTLGLSTPRGGFGLWAGRSGQTPTPTAKLGELHGSGNRAWRHGWDDSGGAFASPYSRSIYNAGHDDTPVTRAPRLETTVQGRRLWDSPGFARPTTPLVAKTEAGEEAMETEGYAVR
ncbi:hypothetical protein BD413DRAFT_554168 [Trametes elegans]|nr:hypothetical protein BD413DRAFT_554168 [Trametes elegans]